MSISAHTGMNTYNRILQDMRSKGEPIGPKHFEYNQQRKKWEARQSNLKQLAGARAAKKSKAELREAKVSMNKARERIAAKAKEVTQHTSEADRLREKLAQLNRQKIADGYKTPSWAAETDKIKSRGNGL